MKNSLFLLAFILLSACGNDDRYDPVAQLDEDLEQIDAHLAEANQAVIIHSSGIRYFLEETGSGEMPEQGDSVATRYDIFTLDNRLVDTTDEDLARANGIYSPNDNYDPFVFRIGDNSVIEGYEIGVGLLNEGAQGVFYIPSTLAYRNTPRLGLERNEILIVRLKLEDIL